MCRGGGAIRGGGGAVCLLGGGVAVCLGGGVWDFGTMVGLRCGRIVGRYLRFSARPCVARGALGAITRLRYDFGWR